MYQAIPTTTTPIRQSFKTCVQADRNDLCNTNKAPIFLERDKKIPRERWWWRKVLSGEDGIEIEFRWSLYEFTTYIRRGNVIWPKPFVKRRVEDSKRLTETIHLIAHEKCRRYNQWNGLSRRRRKWVQRPILLLYWARVRYLTPVKIVFLSTQNKFINGKLSRYSQAIHNSRKSECGFSLYYILIPSYTYFFSFFLFYLLSHTFSLFSSHLLF